MALPPPEKLHELARLFQNVRPQPSQFGRFEEGMAQLNKCLHTLGVDAAKFIAGSAVTKLGGGAALTVGTGLASMAIFPLGAALAPWIGALTIGSKANGIFALHDLRTSARASGPTAYRCSCGHCEKNITYVIDRKETNIAIAAVGIFTLGIPVIVDRINSIRKSFQSNRPKEQICVSLIEGARGGCICAMATIMMLCGTWKHEEKPDHGLVVQAVAVMWSTDGHARLKGRW